MEYPLKLSIVVPVYNVEKYLERCVNSLLNQDLDKDEYEILLVNDGSTDGSFEVARQLANKNTNIKLFTKKNEGLSSTRNFGIQHANGRFIMHVDSDDFLEDNVVGKVLKVAEDNDLELCFFCAKFYPDSGEIANLQPFQLYKIYDGEYILLNGMKVSSTWCNLYSHDFITQVGIEFYGNISHQDVEYNLRLYPFAQRIMFTDYIVYHYCINAESTIHTTNPNKIRNNIESDFHVAGSIKKCSTNTIYSPTIQKYYMRVGNSIAISALIQLAKANCIDKKIKFDCLMTAKRLGVYPIKGRTNSWKTKVLSYVLNIEWLYKMLYL